jgi:hypothetical protein
MKRLVMLLLLMTPVMALGQAPRVGNPHGDMKLDCMLCHTEQSWDEEGRVKDFDHSTTGFDLEGLHSHAKCRDCHKEPVFAHVGTACVDCHQDIHRGRLGPACEDCHTPAGWVDRPQMRRDHDATALPLVGAHERVDCDACHEGAVRSDYVGTPFDCYSCHGDDYHGTTAPDHELSGFGTDCIQCHGVFAATWGSGDFIHSGAFPLTGAHRTAECMACHTDGFAGTPTDCVACHQDDYDGTNDPAHMAAGFPTDCRACHTTNAWTPSTWDHDPLFPIYSGRHAQEWNTCTDCHTVPSNYAVFECILCHEHNQADTDDDHSEVQDYRYLSTDCFRCHPRGVD